MDKIIAIPSRFPKLSLTVLILLTLLFAYQIPNVEVNNNPWDFLPQDTPERVFHDEMVELFDTKDMVMVAVTSDEGIFNLKTLEKIDRLSSKISAMDILDKSDAALLQRAIDLSDGKLKAMLEAISKKGLDRSTIGDLSQALALVDGAKSKGLQVKSILGNLLINSEPIMEVKCLTNIDQIRGTSAGLEVGPLIENLNLSDDELAEIKERVLTDPLMRGMLISTDAKTTLILIKLAFPDTDAVRAVRVYYRLKSIVEEEKGPEKFYIAGIPMAIALSGEYVHRDLELLLPLVVIVIIFVLFLSFGTFKGVLLPLCVVIASVIWSIGAIAWFGIPISMVLSSMPIFLVAVGSAYGIHIMSGYYHCLLTNASRREATINTMKVLLRPVAMTCLTTIVGFGSLSTSSVRPVQYFGVFTAFGVASAMIFTMIFIPAVLVLWGPSKIRLKRIKGIKGENYLSTALAALGKGVVRYRLSIIFLFIIFLIAALVVSLKLTVGEDYIANFRKDSEIRIADTVICRELGGVGTLNIVLQSPEGVTLRDPRMLAKIEELQKRLQSVAGVGKIISLADYVKVLNKAMHEDDPAYYRVPAEVEIERVQTWEQRNGSRAEALREEKVSGRELIAQYLMLYESTGGEELGSVVDFTYRTGQIMALLRTSSTISREKIIIDTEKLIDEIFHDNKEVSLKISGMAALDMVVVKLLIRGQIYSLMSSIALCLVMIVLMFRSFRVGLVCFTPLLLTILLNFAVIVLTDNTLNFGTALTASIAIGIGVDYSIHFVSRYRLLRSEGKDDREAIIGTMQSTGKAIIFNAISVSAGFMVLMLSSFVPVANIGWLVSLVMLSSALGALTIIPAVIPYFLPKG